MARATDLPWFPFFVADWLLSQSVRQMSYAERGAYIELLCYQWREGALPVSPDDIASLSGVPLKLVQRCLTKFPRANGSVRRNPKLAKVRLEQKSKGRKASAAATERWRRERERNADAMRAEQSRSEQSSSRTSSGGIRNASGYACCGRPFDAVGYSAHLDTAHDGKEPT